MDGWMDESSPLSIQRLPIETGQILKRRTLKIQTVSTVDLDLFKPSWNIEKGVFEQEVFTLSEVYLCSMCGLPSDTG